VIGELASAAAIGLARMIRAKQVSPVEVVEAALARLARLEPSLNAFVTVTPELALASARRAEATLMAGDDLPALAGLPVSVKDLIAVEGVRATFGSRTLSDAVAPVDAPSVERLRAAGACILGKTTTSEFGCKPVGDSPLTGITRNPWDLTKTPGGSSCGAASSVAAGITPFALGTDGGGSIRIPAAFTGLFGMKAQFGRVPVFPTSATPTLGHVAPIARRVRDAAWLLQVVAGFDARDPASVSEPVPDFLAACDAPVKGMRIAWSPTLGYARPTAEVAAVTTSAARVFEDLGCHVEEVPAVMDDPVELWMSEFYAGIGTRLRRPLLEARSLLDPAVAEILERALEQSLERYYASVFQRYELRERLRAFFERYDLLVSPTLPVAAFDVGLNVPPELPDRGIVSWVSYTYPFNLTGQPAASLPCGITVGGLPVGLQLVARVNREVDILRAAAAFEAARPFPRLAELAR
jgi:aspartyl-tRNA(Asn)/glutamyl-tRNA(Gln) amidotransferase subunit A